MIALVFFLMVASQSRANYTHCELPFSWQELVVRYKNNQIFFKTGKKLQNSMWVCVKDHYCATGADPYFCFKYHEQEEVFVPWGGNQMLGLVVSSQSALEKKVDELTNSITNLQMEMAAIKGNLDDLQRNHSLCQKKVEVLQSQQSEWQSEIEVVRAGSVSALRQLESLGENTSQAINLLSSSFSSELRSLNSSLHHLAFTGQWSALEEKPNFSLVATSGNFSDIVGVPAYVKDVKLSMQYINRDIAYVETGCEGDVGADKTFSNLGSATDRLCVLSFVQFTETDTWDETLRCWVYEYEGQWYLEAWCDTRSSDQDAYCRAVCFSWTVSN